jgi:lysyl-tRNA synthetase class I
MGLVTIADEYERLASRDFEQELAQEDLSRRQKVQVEDAQAAVRYSVVAHGEEAVSESVSFRHLAMLAQIRTVDDDVFTSLRESGMIDEVTESLKERLHRMRYWISSQHFPEEMKIQLQSNLSDEFLASRTVEDQRIYSEMKVLFESIPWKSDELQSIFGQVSQTSGIAIRDVYRASYMLFLDSEKGPRLAPILEAWNREGVLDLLEQALR